MDKQEYCFERIFNKRIRELRKRMELNQTLFAEKAGISRVTLTGYETTNKYPDMGTFLKIVHNLDINPLWLLGISDDPGEKYMSYSFGKLFPTDIGEVISLNLKKPLNLGLDKKSLSIEDNEKYVYAINEGSKLKLIDPIQTKKENGDSRIYLRYLNVSNSKSESEQKKRLYDFMLDYGFIGRVPSNKFEVSYSVNAIDIINQQSATMFNNRYLDISFENYLVEAKRSLLSYKNSADHKKQFEGYREQVEWFFHDIEKLRKLIIDYTAYGFSYIIDLINEGIVDVIHEYTLVNGSMVQTFGYKSLRALMCYELLFDIKNSVRYKRCDHCNNFHIEESDKYFDGADDLIDDKGGTLCAYCLSHK